MHRVTLFVVIVHKSPKRDYQYPINQIDKILIRKIDYLFEQTCKDPFITPPILVISGQQLLAQCQHS
ncbi:hypothetical protein RY45_07065 [Aeromonas hydrophila]|nr:hypothetical protein RY45_07065 [Aeromonas hydrophila]